MTSEVSPPKSQRSPLLIIFLTILIDLVGFGIIIPLSPYLASDFGATGLEVGLLMTVYSLMQFFFSPIWGRWSDRIGRRPIILLSLMGAALAHTAFAFAESLTVLFIARAFAGIFGANISVATAYIADVTDKKNRSKNMGIIGVAFGLGFIIGPAIGGLLADISSDLGEGPPFGMGFPALGAGLICFCNFIFAFFKLPESLKEELRVKDRLRESRLKEVFRFSLKPVLGVLLVAGFLQIAGMGQLEATFALLMKLEFDWDLKTTSYAFAYIGVMIAFTQGYLIRKLMPKFGERILLGVGLFVGALGMAGIGFSSSVPELAVAVTLLAIGNGLFQPALLGSLSLLSGLSEQGQVMGVYQSYSALGRIIGPALGGILFDQIGMQSPYIFSAFYIFLALIMVVSVVARIPTEGRD